MAGPDSAAGALAREPQGEAEEGRQMIKFVNSFLLLINLLMLSAGTYFLFTRGITVETGWTASELLTDHALRHWAS